MRGSPKLTLLSAALGVRMVGIDGTIVAVANPAIQTKLGASLADIQWVTNGYLLPLAVTLITVEHLAARRLPRAPGHAPIELAGVAAGLQSTAMRVGGTIGTAVLGAIMSAKVDSPTRRSSAA